MCCVLADELSLGAQSALCGSSLSRQAVLSLALPLALPAMAHSPPRTGCSSWEWWADSQLRSSLHPLLIAAGYRLLTWLAVREPCDSNVRCGAARVVRTAST